MSAILGAFFMVCLFFVLPGLFTSAFDKTSRHFPNQTDLKCRSSAKKKTLPVRK